MADQINLEEISLRTRQDFPPVSDFSGGFEWVLYLLRSSDASGSFYVIGMQLGLQSLPEQPRETLASGRSEQITLKTSYDCLRVSGTWLLGDKVELWGGRLRVALHEFEAHLCRS